MTHNNIYIFQIKLLHISNLTRLSSGSTLFFVV